MVLPNIRAGTDSDVRTSRNILGTSIHGQKNDCTPCYVARRFLREIFEDYGVRTGMETFSRLTTGQKPGQDRSLGFAMCPGDDYC